MYFLIGAGGDLGYAVGLMQQFVTYVVSVPGGIIWMRSGQRNTHQQQISVEVSTEISSEGKPS